MQEEGKRTRERTKETRKAAKETAKRGTIEKKQAEKAAKQAEKAAEKTAKQKDNSKQSRKRGRHVRDTFRKRMCRESEIVSWNECIVCLGDYSDDIDSETGKLLKEWIQSLCTNENCAVWMHVECADNSDENCLLCL